MGEIFTLGVSVINEAASGTLNFLLAVVDNVWSTMLTVAVVGFVLGFILYKLNIGRR